LNSKNLAATRFFPMKGAYHKHRTALLIQLGTVELGDASLMSNELTVTDPDDSPLPQLESGSSLISWPRRALRLTTILCRPDALRVARHPAERSNASTSRRAQRTRGAPEKQPPRRHRADLGVVRRLRRPNASTSRPARRTRGAPREQPPRRHRGDLCNLRVVSPAPSEQTRAHRAQLARLRV
jgi:hypothetical protein